MLELLAETIDHGRFHFELIKGRGLLKRDREVFAGRRTTTSVEVTVMTARRTIKFFILRQINELSLLNSCSMVGNSSYLDLQRAFMH